MFLACVGIIIAIFVIPAREKYDKYQNLILSWVKSS